MSEHARIADSSSRVRDWCHPRVVRENYARADEPGVVIVFEVESVAAAEAYVADFPMTRAGGLEWFYIPLLAPVIVESQFSEEALQRAALAPDSPSEIGTA